MHVRNKQKIIVIANHHGDAFHLYKLLLYRSALHHTASGHESLRTRRLSRLLANQSRFTRAYKVSVPTTYLLLHLVYHDECIMTLVGRLLSSSMRNIPF